MFKKLFFSVLLLALITVVIVLIVKNDNNIGEVFGGSGTVTNRVGMFGTASTTYANVSFDYTTSTWSYLSTSTPSVNKVIQIGNSTDYMTMNVCVIASTTEAIVNWHYDFSDDNVNWFREDFSTTTNNFGQPVVKHLNATTTHQWSPSDTNKECKKVDINNINSNWMRVTFDRAGGVISAKSPVGINSYSYSLFAEAILKDGDGN